MRFQGLGGGTDVDRSTFVKYRAIGNLGHGDFAIIIFQPQIIHTAIEGPIIRTGIIDIGVGIFLQIKHWKKIILAGIGKFIVQSNPLKVVIVEATLEEGIARIDELERTINIRIDELIDLKQTAFNMIKRIPDLDQQNILIARYIQNMKWDSIADKMDHEIRWVYKTHGIQALLRAQMISDFNKYSEKGYAPIYARDNFENCWKQYHSLGVNGVMDDLHRKFLELSTDPPEE